MNRAHGGQGEDWQVRMEAHYLVEAVCEPSHGGQGEGLAESNDSPEDEDEAGTLKARTSTRQVQDKGCTKHMESTNDAHIQKYVCSEVEYGMARYKKTAGEKVHWA